MLIFHYETQACHTDTAGLLLQNINQHLAANHDPDLVPYVCMLPGLRQITRVWRKDCEPLCKSKSLFLTHTACLDQLRGSLSVLRSQGLKI